MHGTNSLKVWALMFLIVTLVAPQLSGPQRGVIFIHALPEPIKVRPTVSCEDRCAMEKALIAIIEKRGHCPTAGDQEPCY